jgi:hypothetical protein
VTRWGCGYDMLAPPVPFPRRMNMARTEAPQPDDQPNAPDKDAASKDAPTKEAPKESEPVTTTTDDEGNEVVIGAPVGQVVNGPGEYENEDRPGVSPDWPAAHTHDDDDSGEASADA